VGFKSLASTNSATPAQVFARFKNAPSEIGDHKSLADTNVNSFLYKFQPSTPFKSYNRSLYDIGNILIDQEEVYKSIEAIKTGSKSSVGGINFCVTLNEY
jgi:hypothetical protein